MQLVGCLSSSLC